MCTEDDMIRDNMAENIEVFLQPESSTVILSMVQQPANTVSLLKCLREDNVEACVDLC